MLYTMEIEKMLVLFVMISLSISKMKGEIKCYFIFGDSLVDPGNNNLLPTTAKANYPPYGIDFPSGIPTGRFTNGRTTVDIIAEHLGFSQPIPAFATVGKSILGGVNYASGGSGIRDETGQTLGARISLNTQLVNHQLIVDALEVLLGGKTGATEYLNKCMYSVGMGSNDYINNYFMPQSYDSSRKYTPDQYAAVLIQQYTEQLQTLYDYGARKVALHGVGLIGFSPMEMGFHNTTTPPTVVDLNNAINLFNVKLKLLVDDLNARLSGAKFTFLDTTAISHSKPPGALGFAIATSPCCKVQDVSTATCTPNTAPCTERKKYVFFDNVHPSEGVNVVFANEYYKSSSPAFTHPYDIAYLAEL